MSSKKYSYFRYIYIAAVVVFAVYSLWMVSPVFAHTDYETVDPSGYLTAANKAREEHGQEPLKLDKRLNQAAQAKLTDMQTQHYWAHESPTGEMSWQWVKQAGYDYRKVGENLAKSYSSAEQTTEAWMNSPTHRANLLNEDYQNFGVATGEVELSGRIVSVVVAIYASQ